MQISWWSSISNLAGSLTKAKRLKHWPSRILIKGRRTKHWKTLFLGFFHYWFSTGLHMYDFTANDFFYKDPATCTKFEMQGHLLHVFIECVHVFPLSDGELPIYCSRSPCEQPRRKEGNWPWKLIPKPIAMFADASYFKKHIDLEHILCVSRVEFWHQLSNRAIGWHALFAGLYIHYKQVQEMGLGLIVHYILAAWSDKTWCDIKS